MTETNKETIAQFEYRGHTILICEIKPESKFGQLRIDAEYFTEGSEHWLVPRSQFGSVQSARREAEQQIDFDIAADTIGDSFIAFWQQHRNEGISCYDIIRGIAAGAGGLAYRSNIDDDARNQNADPLLQVQHVLETLLTEEKFNYL